MNRKVDFTQLAENIKQWGQELGFDHIGISDTNLKEAEGHLHNWLKNNFHGDMSYMHKHGLKRTRPAELVPDTLTIISACMNYLPPDAKSMQILHNPEKAYIARYALGRDYHKTLRKRLQILAKKIAQEMPFGYRVFVDSAPVMEKAIAEKAGLGWLGKNTLVLHKETGSWFVLGEIYTDLPLPTDTPTKSHCGSCRACIDICPTQAIIAPYQLDARRCISYLTIEYKGSIPPSLRPKIGNRIFGCDDCQLICPWNKFAKVTQVKDFYPRQQLDNADLITLFKWTEEEFSHKTEGSPLRRAGYVGWLRNIAVALGNAPKSPAIVEALQNRKDHPSELVREHVAWALDR